MRWSGHVSYTGEIRMFAGDHSEKLKRRDLVEHISVNKVENKECSSIKPEPKTLGEGQ
jgi:hypothetical protein